MNIPPEHLPDHGFVALETLEHDALIPFVKTYMGKRNKVTFFYTAANVVILGLCGYLFGYHLAGDALPFSTQFWYFCNGIVLALLLLPIHELLHAAAYKVVGAKQTSIEAHWKKFVFLALADRFVANRREFTLVALAPFLGITLSCIALMFVVPAPWTFTLSSALLAHTAMCSGDFGLLSFFEEHKHLEVVTFDDVAERTSYFWSRER